MKDLRIVIPALNEGAGLATVLDRVINTCPEAELVVVDDGSTDDTAKVAESKGVKVISNGKPHGKGGATKIGFAADGNEKIKFFGFIDADNTYQAENFPQLYKACKDEAADLVVASRFLGKNEGMPWMRKTGNKIFAALLSFYSGRKTTDTSTGQRIFKAELLPIVNSLPDGLDFDTAMTTYVLFNHLSYREIPIDYYERAGESKLKNFRDGFRFLRVIMRSTLKHRPWFFYSTLGIPFLVLNLIVSTVNPDI